MSEFTHSEILFSGDDGLPLEFNVQYAKDKTVLKSLIEYGGGLCTLSDDAIYLVSPGTTVLNVNSSKKLITTSYIFDCVKQNYLLDTDEYRLVINEMETSDISDTSQNLIGNHEEQKYNDDVANDSIDIIDCHKTVSPSAQTLQNSNHDFDFLDSENATHFLSNNIENNKNTNLATSLLPFETCNKPDVNMIEKDNNEAIVNAVPDSLENLHSSINIEENPIKEVCNVPENNQILNDYLNAEEPNQQSTSADSVIVSNLERTCASVNNRENPIREVYDVAANNQILNDSNLEAVEQNDQNISVDAVIVSSSQPHGNVLDQFDNMVLKKALENPVEKDDECLSQSYTVSSSADAQVSPKAPVHNISAEIFDASPGAPDSASQSSERQQYINDLEKEIEQILQKPSPKSIQDKITLVKYICTAKQLPLAIVLQTLQKF